MRISSKMGVFRLSQPHNVNDTKLGGHLNEYILSVTNCPPTWRYLRLGGQSSVELSSVMRVVDESSRDCNLSILLMAFLIAGSAIGSATKWRER